MDWLHYTSIIICIAQITYILLYYCPLANDHINDKGYAGNTFVSDFLFNDNIYRAVMTFFVAFQLGVCVLYISRLRDARKESNRLFFAELILIAGVWIGWSMLCAQYGSPGGGSKEIHFAGVGIFIACSACYVVTMLYHVYRIGGRWYTTTWIEFSLTIMFFIVSIGLGVDFIIGATAGGKLAWVTEHLSFVFFIASHMMLFIFDANRLASSEMEVEVAATVNRPSGVVYKQDSEFTSAIFTEQNNSHQPIS